MKKLLCFILVTLFILSIFTACSKSNKNDDKNIITSLGNNSNTSTVQITEDSWN